MSLLDPRFARSKEARSGFRGPQLAHLDDPLSRRQPSRSAGSRTVAAKTIPLAAEAARLGDAGLRFHPMRLRA
jgi:hypothetical protein